MSQTLPTNEELNKLCADGKPHRLPCGQIAAMFPSALGNVIGIFSADSLLGRMMGMVIDRPHVAQNIAKWKKELTDKGAFIDITPASRFIGMQGQCLISWDAWRACISTRATKMAGIKLNAEGFPDDNDPATRALMEQESPRCFHVVREAAKTVIDIFSKNHEPWGFVTYKNPSPNLGQSAEVRLAVVLELDANAQPVTTIYTRQEFDESDPESERAKAMEKVIEGVQRDIKKTDPKNN